MFARLQHQIRAIHARNILITLQFQDPNQWHTIRRGQTAAVEDVPEMCIPTAEHDPMDIPDHHILSFIFADPAIESINSFPHIDHANSDTQDIYSVRFQARLTL